MIVKLPSGERHEYEFELEQYEKLPENQSIIIKTIDATLLNAKGLHTSYNMNNIAISVTDAEFPNDIRIKYELSREFVAMVLVLEGQTEDVEFGDQVIRWSYHPNEYRLVYRSAKQGYLEIKGGMPIKAVRIIFKPEAFIERLGSDTNGLISNFFDRINRGETGNFFPRNLFITAEMHFILRQIMTTDKKDFKLSIFLESKALELLALVLEYYENQESEPELNEEDKCYRRALEAKHYIEQLRYKLDIDEVAKIAGTNKTTLQKNFKTYFKTSIAKYWKDYKLRELHDRLLQGEIVPKQAAAEMGYRHTNHFATAFSQMFGYTPFELMKSSNLNGTSEV